MQSALWLPIFDDLADPAAVARLSAEAEEDGWHGVFVWDNLRWRAPIRQVADPWITLASIATATERLRFGPMVTPLPAADRPRSPGNRDAGPAQRRPPHARRRSRQRSLRRRAVCDRRGTR
ncbi:LLM class flavin-dependent oxidoreductase [Micromonospora sp. M12]